MLVNDAYKVMSAIVATPAGREAFIASRGMNVLVLLNIRQRFQDDEALELMLELLTYERDKCWDYYCGAEDLFLLLQNIYDNYDNLAASDVDLEDIVETIMLTLPTNSDNDIKNIKDPGSPKTEERSLSIGSVIEICFPSNCDNKSYLSFLHFDSNVIISSCLH